MPVHYGQRGGVMTPSAPCTLISVKAILLARTPKHRSARTPEARTSVPHCALHARASPGVGTESTDLDQPSGSCQAPSSHLVHGCPNSPKLTTTNEACTIRPHDHCLPPPTISCSTEPGSGCGQQAPSPADACVRSDRLSTGRQANVSRFVGLCGLSEDVGGCRLESSSASLSAPYP
jgi:hypothetical protein